MNRINCVGLIPAEEYVNPAAGLNVLVMAINSADCPQSAVVRLFGSIGGDLKELTARECPLNAGEHAHLYYHIDAACFQTAFWGEEPEEMTLYAGVDAPETPGNLVFL